MPSSRGRRLLTAAQLGLAAVGLLAAVALLALSYRVRNAPAAPEAASPDRPADPAKARQVTVFAIESLPGGAEVDPRLSLVRSQLRQIFPDHGFRLIESRSERILPGETLPCGLGEGRRVDVALTRVRGDEGRIVLHCDLFDGDAPPTSTDVEAPDNQLFFFQRTLRDGAVILIGVGAR